MADPYTNTKIIKPFLYSNTHRTHIEHVSNTYRTKRQLLIINIGTNFVHLFTTNSPNQKINSL